MAKIKRKTHSGAAKRFKRRGGKNTSVRFRRANRNHILTKNSGKVVRQRRTDGTLCDADRKTVEEMI